MGRMLREIRRAPVRILTSVFALALAVGAIGVFAIPAVSTSSLRDAAERDGVPDVILSTTPIHDRAALDAVAAIDRVESVEPQRHAVASIDAERHVEVLAVDLDDQTMDVVRIESGRRPEAATEVLVTPGTAPIGSRFSVPGPDGTAVDVEVVGVGRTSSWSDAGVAFADLDHLTTLDPEAVPNRIVIRAADDDADVLGAISDAARERLAGFGVTLTDVPVEIADGRHPIETDIEQISTLIGFLGIVAGLVGLVLLASTANTLVVERSREVAVMRALGATDREVRRRLRRIALGIAAAATVVGLPLGVAISYVIARLVLQEFVGLTPGFAVSWPVLAGSAAFVLVGARLVAARSARRVTARPLAESLRDRDAVVFGRRMSERLAARWSGGRLNDRLALRNGLRNRGRSVAIAAQLGAAVAALLIVASMATTINDFNAAELDPIRWSSMTSVPGPGLDIETDLADGDPRSETAILVEGATAGWQIDVYGWEVDTSMIDRAVQDGSWFEGDREAVVSQGFADRTDIEVGDRIEVELASGVVEYDVVGLHANRGRIVYVTRDTLAADLSAGIGVAGNGGVNDVGDRTANLAPAFGANRLFSLDPEPAVRPAGPTETVRFDDLAGDNGRAAVLTIFGAIGLVVVSVAGLAVMSGLAVNLHERRHELAAMRAVGARRRDLFSVLALEVAVLGAFGVAAGLVGGYVGGRAVARSFEASNAVEIGFTFADRAIPAVIGVVALLLAAVTAAMVRRVVSRPAAVTLRSAA